MSYFGLFHMMHFKIQKRKLFFPKNVNENQKKKKGKSKAEGLESAVCVVGTPNLLIYNSQFKTV